MNNRRKGLNGERKYAKIFRNLGFLDCITTRLGSREMDNWGIDLMRLPFNVQIKTGTHKGMKISEVLKNMKNRIKDKLIAEKPKLIIHEKHCGRGNKRQEEDSLVYMTFADFLKFINAPH